MAIADLADAREVIRRRHDHPAGALHRFGDEGRDRVGALAKNRGFELIGRGHPEADRRIGIDEAVRIRRIDVAEARDTRLEHRPERRQAGGAHRRQREAMVGAMTRDDFGLVGLAQGLPVEPRGLDGAFGRLGAAAGKEERVDRRVGDLAQAFGEGNRRVVGGAGVRRAVGQGRHLLECSGSQFLATVTSCDVPETRQSVQVLAAGRVLEHRTMPLDPDPRLRIRRRMVQRMQEMGAVSVESRSRVGHAAGRVALLPAPEYYSLETGTWSESHAALAYLARMAGLPSWRC